MTARQVFTTGMALLAAAFSKTIDDTLMDAYWLVLEENDPGELESAIKRALRECKFMPPPAVLRGFISEAYAARARIEECNATERRLLEQRSYTPPNEEQMAEIHRLVRGITKSPS